MAEGKDGARDMEGGKVLEGARGDAVLQGKRDKEGRGAGFLGERSGSGEIPLRTQEVARVGWMDGRMVGERVNAS